MSSSGIIRAHVTLVEADDHDQRWHTVLSWDPDQPWHTELRFPNGTIWRFARGVWADGLTGRTWGAGGDVLVEPLPDGDLHLCLTGVWDDEPDGEPATVSYLTSKSLVARFVRDTHEVVPLGREPLPVSVDELLAQLLG